MIHLPSSIFHPPSSFNYILFFSLALFTGILLIRTGVLQSAPAAVVLALVVLGIGMRSGMLVFGVADKIVVEQHDDNNQAECTENTQHDNHSEFSGCAFSSTYDRSRGTLLKETSSPWPGQIYKLPSVLSFFIQRKIMNDGGGCLYADGRNTSWPQESRVIRSNRLRRPFLALLLFGDNQDTADQEDYSNSYDCYSQEKREFLEKMAGQGDCDSRFAQVRNHFSDKFSAFLTDDNHWLDNIMCRAGCQDMLSGASEVTS